MDSLKRIGKLLIGVDQYETPFVANLDLVVCMFKKDYTSIMTVLDSDAQPSYNLPSEWYEEIVKHWVDYVSYGG